MKNNSTKKQKKGVVIPITNAKKLITIGDEIEWIPIFITTEPRRNTVIAIYDEHKTRTFHQINLYSKTKYILLLDNNSWIISDLVVGKLPDPDLPHIPPVYLNKSINGILETYNAYNPIIIPEEEIKKQNKSIRDAEYKLLQDILSSDNKKLNLKKNNDDEE